MDVLIIFFWFSLSLIIAAFGSNKKIGFWLTLFISLLFSPLIGLLAVVLSGKPTSGSEAAENIRKADKAMKSNNFLIAIDYLNKSISYNASPTAHYKLVICYSKLKDSAKSFRHLNKALELGFSDYEKMENDPRLEWIRQQPGYTDFKKNGYTVLAVKTRDNISQLKDLADLRQNNMISEQEYNEQKAKLLSS